MSGARAASVRSSGLGSREGLVFAAALVAALGMHTALVLYFDPPRVLFGERPIDAGDYQTHFGQARRVIEGIEGWGKTWVYDVHLLAGYPGGTIFDADNKAWELWTYALYKLGLPQGTAFNSYLLLAHFLLLPVIFASARIFGLGRWGALAAVVMGSWLWFFDSFLHFCWIGGMVSYAMASYFFLLPLSLFYRFLQGQAGGRGTGLVLAAGILMGLGHLIHPYTFFIMLAPMSALYLRASRKLDRRGHLTVALIPLVVIGINCYWLLPAISFWHYILDSGYCGQTTLSYLPADFFGLLLDPTNTGLIGSRTGFRFLCLGAAVVTLLGWRRENDPRFLPFAVGIGFLLVLAYAGGYFKAVAQIQPYRHVAAATFFSLIPAVVLIEQLWRSGALRALPRLARAVLLVLALPALQHLASDVIYFFPEQMPSVSPLFDGSYSTISATGFPAQHSYRHTDRSPGLDLLVRWVKLRKEKQGRILVQGGMDGEALAWMTDAEILGGFPLLNLEHAYANLFRPYSHGDIDRRKLRRYLENYAVRWVVISSPHIWFDDQPELLKLAAKFAQYRIYRVEITPSYFQQGSGTIEASTNRIEVRNTDPNQTLVLRYHWLETLVCEPGCRLQRSRNPWGGVDFIRVPAPHPRDLVIRNGY